MSIKINQSQCIGCAKCTNVCPGSLIKVSDKKAQIRYPKDCWGCVSCVKECPVKAIEFYLGADIGGKGTTLTVEKEDHLLHWEFTSIKKEKKIITIDSTNANQY